MKKIDFNMHVATIQERKKPFKCDVCSTSFDRKGHLNLHVATVHEGKKQYQCDICQSDLFRFFSWLNCWEKKGHGSFNERFVLL